MKRTWVVTVGAGVGHEYHDLLSFMEIYGPYTEKQAKSLAGKLNKILRDSDEDSDDGEGDTATPMSLYDLAAKDLIQKYKNKDGNEY